MGDYARGELDLDDEDRLPWLEPAIDEEEESVSPLKLLGFIVAGLILLGAVVGGLWWMQNRHGGSSDGEGVLIAAPEDSYKIAANEADAKTFEGEGDASYAASEGVQRDGRIDPSRVPEAPITGTTPPAERALPAAVSKPSQRVSAPVADETQAANTPASAKRANEGGLIQLGAYATESGAKDGWKTLSRRFAYLTPLSMHIESAQVGGGTVYRLRASAGAQASTLCGKLKVAGESCLVVN